MTLTPDQQTRLIAMLADIADTDPFIDMSEGAYPRKCLFCYAEEREGHATDCSYHIGVQLLQELREA